MKKFNLKNILSSLFVLGVCLMPGLVSAACDSNYWGINTHSSSSLGGLVVGTKNNSTLQNMVVEVGGTSSSVVKVNSDYSQGTGYSALSWSTGSTYYCAAQSSACSAVGYLVMGNGSSGSQGNAYALDCKNSSGGDNTFYAKVTSANPTAYGYWVYTLSGHHSLVSTENVNSSINNRNPKVSFTVNNGYTAWVTFNWVPQSPPNYTLTVNINPLNAATATGAGTYAPGSTATAGYRSVVSGYTFSGWTGDAGCGSAMTMNANHTCTANFTASPASLSCSVLPQSGLAPLVVMVTTKYSGLGTNPTFSYNFGDRTRVLPNRPATVYYTYAKAGTYTIFVSNPNYNGGEYVECSPTDVMVSNPTDNEGGEVTP